MKRGFLGSSKKEHADSRTIRKSTREESIDTLQAASIDSVNQGSNDTNQLGSDNTVHHDAVHHGIVHHDTVHPDTIHQGTVHLDIVHRGTVHLDIIHPASIDHVHPPSIDTVHPPSIDTVHPSLIDTIHPSSIDTVHPDTIYLDTVHHDTVHLGTVHPDIVHPVKNDTTCGEIEKIEVLILKGAVIPEVITVAEMNDFDLSKEWYDWVGQDSYQGLPHPDPRNHIEELEDLVSRSEQNEVSEYHMLWKIFPYSISGDAF
ncbi:hypothetical protein DY000_02014994 [Brassica cretica]|uniref:Uncharacterized protein n=1 Tax=Brassica cretica TaxID=69181 RepID=A0ABQ7CPK9_BRACR|nr:hypothetical protein DY000_02014994 [Brassica cretica]